MKYKIFWLSFLTITQLLGELLLDRHNFSIMTRYISNPENLKLMMNMLKEKSRNIQFEAFHVFKVGLCWCIFHCPFLVLLQTCGIFPPSIERHQIAIMKY